MADKPDFAKIKEERHGILEQICNDLNEALIAAVVSTAEEIPDSPEILNVHFDEIGVSHDEVFGEFFFHNIVSEEDVTGIFNGLFTIYDNLPEENLAKVYEAISVLNYYIRNGAFGVSADRKMLTFRVCLPYPLATGKQELYDMVNTTMGNAYVILDEWVDIVLRVAEGETDVESVISALGL